jgi:hypothetical protein
MEKLMFGWEMVRIETMQRQTDYLEILISPTTASAVCPLCEQSSARVHSAYQRSLQQNLATRIPLGLLELCRPSCDNLVTIIDGNRPKSAGMDALSGGCNS